MSDTPTALRIEKGISFLLSNHLQSPMTQRLPRSLPSVFVLLMFVLSSNML